MATVPKNFRFQQTTCELLDAVVKATGGSNDSRIAELCIAKHCMEIGVEVMKARQFIYENLMGVIATHRLHQTNPNVTPEQYLNDLKAAVDSVRRLHEPRSESRRRGGKPSVTEK